MATVDITKMEPYAAPLNPNAFSQATFVFLGIGLVLTAYFFIQEVTVENKKRSFITEVLLSGIAALFLGFGTFRHRSFVVWHRCLVSRVWNRHPFSLGWNLALKACYSKIHVVIT
uniref:Transmembrane protein 258 n=1 Tax=Panagrolaimus sp. JU765 TaxID=591449 RepID=A0AC34QID8_9BILA